MSFAQIVKPFGDWNKPERERSDKSPEVKAAVRIGRPDVEHISTSYVERHNLTMRKRMERYARKTNAFSKKMSRHECEVALYAIAYNFIWTHGSLGKKTTPAMAAGLADRPYDWDWFVGEMNKRKLSEKIGIPFAEIRKAPAKKRAA